MIILKYQGKLGILDKTLSTKTRTKTMKTKITTQPIIKIKNKHLIKIKLLI